jgi:hypothetical protein
MNMFKTVKASSVKEYFENLPEDRLKIVKFIHNFILKVAPSLESHFAYNMLGYGKFKYKNYKKEEIYWPTIALASQKNYISLYICALEDGEYVAEKYKKELGRVSVGKSCIRFKKIDDLNLKTLEKAIKLAEKSPGIVLNPKG